MGKNKWVFLLFLGVTLLFFYPIFLGKIPFPGDLLISEYSPWKYFSFLGYAPGGYPEKFQYFDVLRQMYPWTTFAIKSLKTFHFPLWNPYNFSGSPLFANSQSAVLYPLHLFYFLLPQTISWTILVMLQPFLISIFTYLYVRKIGMGKWGSVLTSLAFGFSLFISVFLEYNTMDQVIIFLPFLLWITELLFEKKTIVRILAFVLGIAFVSFAGHIQLLGFVILFVSAYVLFKLTFVEKKIRQLLFFGLLLVLGFGVSMVQLLPTFELIQNAARSSQEYAVLIKNLLLQPYQSILFLSPDIFGNPATRNYLLSDSYPGNAVYIGLIPFFFGLFGLSLFRKNTYVSFFTGVIVVLALLFFNSPFTQLFYRFQIPLLSTGSPTNAIFLLSFSVSLLAGFGFEKFVTQKNKKIILLSLGLLGIFAVGILLFKTSHMQFVLKNALYTFGLLVALLMILLASVIFPKWKRLFAVCLIVITIGDLFYFSHKFNPFVKPSLVYPPNSILSFLKTHEGNNRFWSYGNASIASNIATQYGLFDVNGYDPLYPKAYGEFVSSVFSGKLASGFSDTNRSDALLPSAYTADDFLKNKNELRVLDLLEVKYVVTKDDPKAYFLTQKGYKLVLSQNGWQIYQNQQVFPRAFVVYKTQTYTSPSEFTNIFYSNTFNPQTTIVSNKSLPSAPEGNGNARILTYLPNEVRIAVETSTPGYLFLSDTYFPGWVAQVDGRITPIIKADYAFRAVGVPKGKHVVTFVYQPASFSLGLTLTIITIAITFALALVSTKKKL